MLSALDHSKALRLLSLAVVASTMSLPMASAQPMEAPASADAARATSEARQVLERNLEAKAQSMLDEIIGAGRSVVRVSAELQPGTEDMGATISRLSIALSVGQTKVVIDPTTREIGELLRPEAEIAELASLVMAAVGYDASRGDNISVNSMPFDRTQELQRREMAVSGERKIFWTRLLMWLVLAAALILFSLWLRRASGPGVFANDTPTRAALAVSLGLFFCLMAAGVWEDGLSFRAVSTIPGAFLLIVGASRLFEHLRAGARDT